MYSKLIQHILEISPSTYSYRNKCKSWTVKDQIFIQKALAERGIIVSLEQVTYEYLRF